MTTLVGFRTVSHTQGRLSCEKVEANNSSAGINDSRPKSACATTCTSKKSNSRPLELKGRDCRDRRWG